jgi:thioredoxin 1
MLIGLQIRALPTVIAFKDGKPTKQFSGALSEPEVRNFLKEV